MKNYTDGFSTFLHKHEKENQTMGSRKPKKYNDKSIDELKEERRLIKEHLNRELLKTNRK